MADQRAVDPHIQALRDALVADTEWQIAEAQRLADEAPDEWWRKLYTARLERFRSTPYPWEDGTEVP